MNSSIVFIQWSNNFGGLEKITKDYFSHLSNYNPMVLFFDYNPDGFNYPKYFLIKKRNKIKFFIDYMRFVFIHRDKIFHFQIGETILILVAKLLGVQNIVCQFHGTYSSKTYLERIIWKYLNTEIKIVANSNYTKGKIVENYGITKSIFIVPNLIDQNQFYYLERTYNDEDFIVTYAGRLAQGKNLFLLLDVANILKGKNENIKFKIYGDGPEKEKLSLRITELSLDSIVAIEPFSSDITKIYHESHLLIFLSLFETFGNVVAEAILTGLPVICYKIPSLSELINDETFFVNEQNPNKIVEKIIDFRNNYSVIKQKIKLEEANLRSYLNNEKVINKLEEIYKFKKAI